MPTSDDYTIVAYDAAPNSESTGIAEIIVKYELQEICLHTYIETPYGMIQEDTDWNNLMDSVIESVRQNIPTTVPNPSYDPLLTECWT